MSCFFFVFFRTCRLTISQLTLYSINDEEDLAKGQQDERTNRGVPTQISWRAPQVLRSELPAAFCSRRLIIRGDVLAGRSHGALVQVNRLA